MRNKQNIVFIITDQQRYDSIGCTGNAFAVTPNLDELAKEGTVFERCITANAVCCPSRASIVTGLYPSAHGLWTNGVALPRNNQLPVNKELIETYGNEQFIISHIPTMADIFVNAGYATSAIGKIHLSPYSAHSDIPYAMEGDRWGTDSTMKDWHGPYYGFQYVEITRGHGELKANAGHYANWLKEKFPEVAEKLKNSEHRKKLEFPEHPDCYQSCIPVEAHNSTYIGDKTCEQIQKLSKEDKPFLIWTGFPDPHSPFVPPKELAEEFETHDVSQSKCSSTIIDNKPSALSRKYKKQKEKQGDKHNDYITRTKQYTDALNHLIDINVGKIIKTLKDLGEWDNTILIFTSDHGDWLGDWDMTGKGAACCKSLNHVPMIGHFPKNNFPSRVKTTISNVDILPTLCDLTQIETENNMQGESIKKILEKGRDNPVMVQHYSPKTNRNNISIYDDNFRFTWYTETNEKELYNHSTDPNELHNLVGNEKDKEVEMMQKLMTNQCKIFRPQNGRFGMW